MTGKRSRGRPPDSEDERWQRAQAARRTVNEELAAMQSAGLKPSQRKAKACAARRLGISTKTLERQLDGAVDFLEAFIAEWKQDAWEEWSRNIDEADLFVALVDYRNSQDG